MQNISFLNFNFFFFLFNFFFSFATIFFLPQHLPNHFSRFGELKRKNFLPRGVSNSKRLSHFFLEFLIEFHYACCSNTKKKQQKKSKKSEKFCLIKSYLYFFFLFFFLFHGELQGKGEMRLTKCEPH